jgi:phosphatidylglycerophosphate synthase
VVRHAYLVGQPGLDPGLIVGGLPAGVRQRLSLAAAGIANIVSVGGAPPVGSTMAEAALVAADGAVWHPSVVRRLARTPIAEGQVAAAGGGAAAIYLASPTRVAETVACVAGAAAVRADLFVELTPSEFVVLPRTRRERELATTQLLRSLDKPTDGVVSRHLHRPLSRAVTRRLLNSRVTPNTMTLVAAAFGVAGVLIAWRGGYGSFLAGAILFEIQNVLDGCDGEIARLKHLSSRVGEWLDQVVDDLLNIAFLSAVGIGLAGTLEWTRWVTVAAIAAQVIHLIGLYAGLVFRAGGRGSVARLRWKVDGGGAGSRTLGDLTRRDFLSFLYVASAAAGVIALAFVWHTLVTFGSAAVTTVQWIAWNGPEAYVGSDGATDPAGEAAV